jgi:hypothetical protein
VKDAEAPSFSGRRRELAIGCRMGGVRVGTGLEWSKVGIEGSAGRRALFVAHELRVTFTFPPL